MTDEPHLLTENIDGILIATLNRPDKLNALSAETMQLFEQTLLHFRDDSDLRVMLIRATGRYFCSGADLRGSTDRKRPETATEIRENHRIGLNGMHRIYDEMEHIEKPIVSAIRFQVGGKKRGFFFPRRIIRRVTRFQRGQPVNAHLWSALGTMADHGQSKSRCRTRINHGTGA